MIKSWGPSGTTATQEKLSKIVALINFTWTMNKKKNNDVFTWEVPQKTVTDKLWTLWSSLVFFSALFQSRYHISPSNPSPIAGTCPGSHCSQTNTFTTITNKVKCTFTAIVLFYSKWALKSPFTTRYRHSFLPLYSKPLRWMLSNYHTHSQSV